MTVGEDPEALATRRRLYDLTVATPGLTAAELAIRTGLPAAIIGASLRPLEQAGHLRRERGLAEDFYFATAVRPSSAVTQHLAGSRLAGELLLAVLEIPGISTNELADRTGRGRGSIVTILRPTIEAGIVAAVPGPAGASYHVLDRRRLGEIVAPRPGVLDRLVDGVAEVWGELLAG